MVKLTVISGPNRGTSYAIQEGETTIGRQAGNTVMLQSSKVSKKHCAILLSNGEIVVKDLNSSNGTFVNGILTILKKVKPGDRISVGEYVFELVEPVKKSVPVAPAVSGLGNVLQLPSAGVPSHVSLGAHLEGAPGMPIGGSAHSQGHKAPQDIKGKLIWMFEHQIMPYFYGMNLKNEWRMICLGMFGVLVLGNLVISVYPLLESSRVTLVKETGLRAKFMARQIAEMNAPVLAARAETKADLGIVESGDGVRLAVLVDLDNRIIAPGSKLNQYLSSGPEALSAVKAKNAYRDSYEGGFIIHTDENTITAIEPVKVLSPTAGKNVVVAMAIVSIDTSLSTPDMGEMGVVYSETLILTGLLAGLIFIILYRVTLKPFQVLNEDMDKALKGDISQVTHTFRFEEMNPLWEIINSAIQRIPKEDSSSQFGGGAAIDPAVQVEEFLGPLRAIGNIAKFGMVVFSSDKKIYYINSIFEEMSGIRSDSSIGQEMSAVARDQSMGIFTNEILDRVMTGNEGASEDYDFSGISYKMYAAAFGSASGSPKCYVLAAVRVEG